MPFQCDHCDKTIVIKSKYTCHQIMHSGEKPFKCDHCEKTFVLNSKLTSHQKTHIEEKPCKYEESGVWYEFCSRSGYYLGSRNSGEKLYNCDEHYKSFHINVVLYAKY